MPAGGKYDFFLFTLYSFYINNTPDQADQSNTPVLKFCNGITHSARQSSRCRKRIPYYLRFKLFAGVINTGFTMKAYSDGDKCDIY